MHEVQVPQPSQIRHRGACLQSRVWTAEAGVSESRPACAIQNCISNGGKRNKRKDFCHSKVDHVIKLMSVLATSLRRWLESWVTLTTQQTFLTHDDASNGKASTVGLLSYAPVSTLSFLPGFCKLWLENWVLLLSDVHITKNSGLKSASPFP